MKFERDGANPVIEKEQVEANDEHGNNLGLVLWLSCRSLLPRPTSDMVHVSTKQPHGGEVREDMEHFLG